MISIAFLILFVSSFPFSALSFLFLSALAEGSRRADARFLGARFFGGTAIPSGAPAGQAADQTFTIYR